MTSAGNVYIGLLGFLAILYMSITRRKMQMLIFVIINFNYQLTLKVRNLRIMRIDFAKNALLEAIFLLLRGRNPVFHFACLPDLNMMVTAKLLIFCLGMVLLTSV